MIPTLTSRRLTLRPFTAKDASTVQSLAGTEAVANTTLNIPFPYPDGEAERWIATHGPEFRNDRGVTFAICLTESQELIGAITLQDVVPNTQAEIGYWIGEQFWGKGYASEAAEEIIQFGFAYWNLKKIRGRHLTRNPASGRVLQKVGMAHTFTATDHRWKTTRESVEIHEVLRPQAP